METKRKKTGLVNAIGFIAYCQKFLPYLRFGTQILQRSERWLMSCDNHGVLGFSYAECTFESQIKGLEIISADVFE